MTRLLRGLGLVTAALLLALVTLCTLVPEARASGDEPTPDGSGVWPLQPTPSVVRGFDPPGSPYGSGHRGVDLLGRPGEPVHASLAGTVSFAGRLAGRGVVVVDHGSTRTTYEPVAASAHVGDVVGRGQVVGRLELASSHCFPQACLHWGWIQNGTDPPVYLDPLLLVGGGPVRLLPLAGLAGTPPSTIGPPTLDPATIWRRLLTFHHALG